MLRYRVSKRLPLKVLSLQLTHVSVIAQVGAMDIILDFAPGMVVVIFTMDKRVSRVPTLTFMATITKSVLTNRGIIKWEITELLQDTNLTAALYESV